MNANARRNLGVALVAVVAVLAPALMREGYTVVSVGWEFDIPKKKGLVLLDAPVATDNGKPITGWIDPGPWFIPDKLADSYNYASGDFTPSYPPLDLKNPTYRLTERDALVSFPHLVPREDWQFGRVENGQVVTDANWVTMKGGFKPGMVYQLAYESSNPPVAGVGFAAVRDLASAVKYNSDAIVRGKYVYTFGSSQVGRWQRQMIYEGFTIDEQGRKAVDALFIQTGGTGLGSFNDRWAQPALLAALDRWVREGVTPPPSLHPMLADRTAVPQNEIKFPNVPGVQWPYHVPGGFRNDLIAGPTSVLPFLVPRADKDGNVISGLRLPEQSVPLGTYGGWAFRSESYGQSDTLVSMAGSYIPFAKTKAEREKTGDPRLSVEERYSSRADYVHRVEESARKLVQERYLLQEDVALIVEAAGQHWDWTMNSTTTQSRK